MKLYIVFAIHKTDEQRKWFQLFFADDDDDADVQARKLHKWSDDYDYYIESREIEHGLAFEMDLTNDTPYL